MGMQKKVSMIADDSIFILKCELEHIEHFVTILDQFQKVTGLKINFDKSRIIPLKFLLVPYGTPFKYLGTRLRASDSA